MLKGNCYVTSEAVYHLLGGKSSGWKPMVLRMKNGTHWFLKHQSGLILDLTSCQFDRSGEKPDYTQARGTGFLTKESSKRASVLMKKLIWQE